jgi:predicted RNA-binding protein YlxR (DUF448 family)
MTNKHFMIFQTAVRKCVDMHEKSQSDYLFRFYSDFKNKIKINFGRKISKIFLMF